jgi:Spy/CpxP family protein refolding chaperone
MVMGITIDLNKAKNIAHEKRRAARTTEFAPLDIKATIPSEAAAAEAARQAIREKYATLQAQMDAAQTPEQLKALLPEA